MPTQTEQILVEFDHAARTMTKYETHRRLHPNAVLLFSEADAIHLHALGVVNDAPTAEACGIQ